MNIPPLHPTPAWRTVAAEQVRVVGIRLRTSFLLLGLAFLILCVAVLNEAWSVRQTNLGGMGHAEMRVGFSPEMSVVFAVLAILSALLAWQDAEPPRRAYFLSMPVVGHVHLLTKALAGLVWEAALTAAFLAGFGVLGAIAVQLAGNTGTPPTPVYAWEWGVPFTAMAIAYALSSAAAIGSRLPAIWILIVPAYGAVIGLLWLAGMPHASSVAATVWSGYYGLSAALSGHIEAVHVARAYSYPSWGRWLGTAGLWGAVSGTLVVAVAAFRGERS